MARACPFSIVERPPAPANCRLGGGCADAGQGDALALSDAVLEKVKRHPCYSEDAHHHFARMHLAVAPACNIQCHYCNRKFDCANESRPGVASERLTPAQALRKVQAVAARLPQLSVVGIAGPGDPLANPDRTFATLELVKSQFPDLRLCVSTNGLALPESIDRLVEFGVEHVTVTVNMVDPAIGERIHPWIVLQRRRIEGREASRILSERQLAGIEALAARGVLVKVNSVLIPGVNDAHLPEVSRKVRSLGAFLHNVMPLISSPAHGTHFGLIGQREPNRDEMERVQAHCAADTRVMRHCRQCRADAIGLLGQDRGQEFTRASIADAPEPGCGGPERARHRIMVEGRQAANAEARDIALAAARDVPAGLVARVAVATRGDALVNQHFGHATEFQVHEVSREGVRLVGTRRVEHYCRGGDDDEAALASILRAVSDCAAVLAAKVGRCPRETLEAAGIEAVDRYAFEPIEAAVLSWLREHARRACAPAPVRAAAGEVA